MHRGKKYVTYLLIVIALLCQSTSFFVYAAEPAIGAVSAIMIDEPTGKVLYAKDPDKRMYPASTTKILTALVAMEYITADEIIVAGNEVYSVPIDSSKAGHVPGESIRGDHLYRGLIIPSGNETACVVAMEVAKRYAKDETGSLNYAEAEHIFCDLMNKKAEELGATNSNFVNPHGYHDPEHYTTAKDMALITREAMKNPLLRQIVKERDFAGNGAGENPDPSWTTQDYQWETHNELLIPGDYYYEYATGIKTGFTDEAGSSLVASAEKEGKAFITVVFFSPDPGRWTDAAALFDYGFETFQTETVQAQGNALATVAVDKPRLGDSGIVTAVAAESFSTLLSKDELARVTSEVTYDTALIAQSEESLPGEGVRLKTPIAPNDKIGTVTYALDGTALYTGTVLAKEEALTRTFNTDLDYYFTQFKNTAFSVGAIPYWIGIVLLVVLLIWIAKIIGRRRYRRGNMLRNRY